MSGKPIDDAVRAQFEAWAQAQGRSTNKWVESGEYSHYDTQRCWQAWQAALAAAQQQGQAVALCGTCNSTILQDAMTGTRCACTPGTAPPTSVPDDLLRQAAAVLERFRTLDDDAITVINRINKRVAAAPPSVPVGVDGTWLWGKLMDWCREQRIAPATQDKLFAIAGEAHRLNALAQQAAAVDEVVDFEIHAGGEYFASVGGPRERAWKEAMHYVSTLSPDDGEPEVFEVTRRKVALATQHQEPTT